jgi:hypothetical protein
MKIRFFWIVLSLSILIVSCGEITPKIDDEEPQSDVVMVGPVSKAANSAFPEAHQLYVEGMKKRFMNSNPNLTDTEFDARLKVLERSLARKENIAKFDNALKVRISNIYENSGITVDSTRTFYQVNLR